jgi:hypothetical protein
VLLHGPGSLPDFKAMCAGTHPNASCSFQGGMCRRFFERAVWGEAGAPFARSSGGVNGARPARPALCQRPAARPRD